MNGAIHCMVFNQEGTIIGIGHGAELSIVRAKTICVSQHPKSTIRRPDKPLAATWSTVQRIPDPPSLPGLDENEVLPPPSVRSLHFIGSGKMLVVAYLDHGFVSVALLVSCRITLTFTRRLQLLELEFPGGSMAFGSAHLLHVSGCPSGVRYC